MACRHSSATRSGTRRSRSPQTRSVGARMVESSCRKSRPETKAIPQAWKTDDVDGPSSAQMLEHGGPPAPRSCEAVNEHERFAAAGCSVPDGATVDLDLVELYRHLIQSGRCGRRSCRSDWSEPTA